VTKLMNAKFTICFNAWQMSVEKGSHEHQCLHYVIGEKFITIRIFEIASEWERPWAKINMDTGNIYTGSYMCGNNGQRPRHNLLTHDPNDMHWTGPKAIKYCPKSKTYNTPDGKADQVTKEIKEC